MLAQDDGSAERVGVARDGFRINASLILFPNKEPHGCCGLWPADDRA